MIESLRDSVRNQARSMSTSPESSNTSSKTGFSVTALLATGFGLGRVVVSPGTMGTALEGLPLAWAISQIPNVGLQAVVIAVLFGVGVPLCTAAGRALGGSKDNQSIIWDEIVTMPVVFL